MENKRYLLKAPDHLMHIETILDVFPDATFIFTFRRLSQIIPSFCALILVMNEQFGGTVNEKWKKRYFLHPTTSVWKYEQLNLYLYFELSIPHINQTD